MDTTTTNQTPTIRLRVNHTHTVRSGWQHESTVEIVQALPGDPDGDTTLSGTMRFWLRQIDELGRAEAERRNGLETTAP